jgi:DNA polymerase
MQSRGEYLAALGIDDWRQRRAMAVASAAPQIAPEAAVARVPVPVAAATAESWETIASEVAACRKCGLCETRTRTVFGVGDRNAAWLVVGEAPGAEEDKQGEPFVGRAGGLLNSMPRPAK